MKERFLHYIWNYQKFDMANLRTVCHKKIAVLQTGVYQDVGADFFNAQLLIDNQRWAGNVEIHLKSSDWYLHNHHNDANYDNVILHVVWDYDTDVYRQNNTEIPVLQLKDYVLDTVNQNYMNLTQNKSWIYCENQINSVKPQLLDSWKDDLFKERLLRKTDFIQELLSQNQNNWEATLFCMLAKNFGLNTNGELFFEMSKLIPFQIIRKESFEVENLEALFFGCTHLLEQEFEDRYANELKQRWNYLKTKHQLDQQTSNTPEFFRHRPDNFPTIRLSQLAMLYHKNQYFFDAVIQTSSLEDFYKLFATETSDYWQNHYTLDKESPKKRKTLSKSFIDLLLINTVIPFRYAYQIYLKKSDDACSKKLLSQVKPEQNIIIEKFQKIGISSRNAYDTQALLQLKNNYCNHKRCLECKIGISLLKS